MSDYTLADIEAAKAKLNADMRERWDDASFRREFAADLAESIWLGYSDQSLVDLVADVSRVTLDAKVYVRELKGLRAFWTARGGFIEQSELSQDEYELVPDSLGVRVREHEEAIATRIAETAVDLKTQGVKQIDLGVNQRFLKMLQAATPSNDANDNYTLVAGVTLDSVRDALMKVADATEGSKISIIGRSTMVHQVMNAVQDGSFFTPTTNENLIQRGQMGTFNGAQLITVKNVRGGAQTIPNNELYVVAEDAAKVAFFGDIKAKERVDDNWYWHWVTRLDVGMLLHHTDRVERIVDSSL